MGFSPLGILLHHLTPAWTRKRCSPPSDADPIERLVCVLDCLQSKNDEITILHHADLMFGDQFVRMSPDASTKPNIETLEKEVLCR